MQRKNRAPIIQNGGFMLIPSIFSNKWLQAIQQECSSQQRVATVQQKRETDHSQWRGSNPDRFLVSASGDHAQAELYQSGFLHCYLSQLCGRALTPTGGQGSYSYYNAEGHYLGLHRDIDSCDLTLITCLKRVDHAQTKSGALRVYRNCLKQELSEINEQSAHTDFHLREGESIVLLGGWLPHEVLPAAVGFQRHISALCFKLR